jgi:hypothetical protein
MQKPLRLRAGGNGRRQFFLEDMIKGTDKGILVTRFWYIRLVDQQTLLLTGLTRDGTFISRTARSSSRSRISASMKAR